MPNIRHVWQLIWHGDYAFSIDLQDAYLDILVVKHHCIFTISLVQNTIPVESFTIWP